MQIAWRQVGEAPVKARGTVQETYLWDLRVESCRLTGLLNYSVTQGVLRALQLEIPEDVEVESVKAYSLLDGQPLTLKEWRYRGKARRQIQVEFARLTTGAFQLHLQFIPRAPLGPLAALQVPAPRDAGFVSEERFLGYTLLGLDVRAMDSLQVVPTEGQRFQRRWRTEIHPEGPVDWQRLQAFSIRPLADGRDPTPTLVRLHLQPRAPRSEASQDITWRVGPLRAEFRAAVHLTAAEPGQSLVEWDVPTSVQVTQVAGPNVHHWSRKEERLQVWLDRSRDSASLTVSGSLPQSPDATDFTLPALTLLTSQTQATVVRLIASSGLVLGPVRLGS